MNEFADRPFAAGSLIGLRVFHVERGGVLRGPAYPIAFDPGVNEAGCYDFQHAFLSVLNHAVRSTFDPGHPLPVIPRSRRSQMGHHQVAGLGCSCGIYAYTDTGEHRYRDNAATIDAIIEGFGVCTVGSRGFKASKARLVALIDPAPYPLHRRRNDLGARRFPQVRDRFGDVPVYKSIKAAVKAHPLGAKVGA